MTCYWVNVYTILKKSFENLIVILTKFLSTPVLQITRDKMFVLKSGQNVTLTEKLQLERNL